MVTDQNEQIDNLILEYFRENNVDDHDGLTAAVSASQKLQWANSAAVGYEEIDSRLNQLCECLGDEGEHSAVPRYRWKSAGDPAQ